MSLLRRIEQGSIQPPSDFKDKFTIREWWHGVLRDYGRYSCYAIFLALPSDKETLRYLVDFGNELDIISGEACLVITLGKTEFKRSGFDEEIKKPSVSERFSNFLEEAWSAAIKEQVSKGYSMKIAQLFNIELTNFPCLLIFQDIRSSDHAQITLKGMIAEEIAERMRATFSIIHTAVSDKKPIIETLASHQNSETLRKAGKTIFSKASGVAEKTFETAIEAWIGALVK
jgi:hypothetical protein